MSIQTPYPFPAVVGQEDFKQALLLAAVNPAIGGVLVRGDRGTGKSTLARAFADVLPDQEFTSGCPIRCQPAEADDCPFCRDRDDVTVDADQPRFVDLPLGVSEERLTGSLDVEEALNSTKQSLQPGLLARANRGLLYVDEINLLPDRLVDLLLDTAASGVHHLERDGLSVRHPANYLLIGSMNPDEGPLRPQLRDRFGLCVHAETIADPDQRAELARRVSAFEQAPEEFRHQYTDDIEQLRSRITAARNRLKDVEVPDEIERKIAETCLDAGVEGHRADVVIRQASRARASWHERESLNFDDVRVASRLALNHRGSPPSGPGGPSNGDDRPDRESNPFQETTDSERPDQTPETTEEESVPAPRSARMKSQPKPTENHQESTKQAPRRRRRPPTPDSSGRLDPAATLRRSARDLKSDSVQPDHLRFKPRTDQAPTLTLYVLDASSSMARDELVAYVKGAVRKQIQRQQSHQPWWSLVTVRGAHATLTLPPTSNPGPVLNQLDDLPVGGETPLLDGLRTAQKVLHNHGRTHPHHGKRLVLCTDGRVPYRPELLQSLNQLEQAADLDLIQVGRSDKLSVLPNLAQSLNQPLKQLQPGELRSA